MLLYYIFFPAEPLAVVEGKPRRGASRPEPLTVSWYCLPTGGFPRSPQTQFSMRAVGVGDDSSTAGPGYFLHSGIKQDILYQIIYIIKPIIRDKNERLSPLL